MLVLKDCSNSYYSVCSVLLRKGVLDKLTLSEKY